MTTSKRAVDETTRDYWTQYYGKYGEMWVRDIPRKVRAALLGELNRRAAARKEAEPEVQTTAVVPLGHRRTEAGTLALDGLFRAEFKRGEKLVRVARLFVAEFSPEGEMTSFVHKNAPVA